MLRQGQFVPVLCQDIKPGDVLCVVKDERVPADCVILGTPNEQGVCFVDTMNLDGETSLKRRTAVPYSNLYQSAEQLSYLSGCVECELPNERLNAFEGVVTMDYPNRIRSILPLTLDNLLLRGTYLRNTEFVYAVVLYAGSETKLYK